MTAPTLTSEQRETLSALLSEHDRDFAIELTRVLVGDKPATVLRMPLLNAGPFLVDDRAAAFLRDLGLATADQGDKYIARSDGWLDRLPSETLSDDDHTRLMGEFYGYPETDIVWFIDTSADDRITPRERVENGDFTPEEIAYVDFLSYVPEDSIDGYQRAIENGKRVRDLLSDVADEWDIPAIEEIAEDHYQSSVNVYAGERDSGVEFRMITKNPAIE